VLSASSTLTLEDFDYELPPELIAQHPLAARSASRLLRLTDERLAGDAISDHAFADLPEFFAPGDLFVFNDTKVIKARLAGVRESGGKIEVLIERVLDAHEAFAMVRASNAPRAGTRFLFGDGPDQRAAATVTGREGDLFHLRFEGEDTVYDILDRVGAVPLPPYITHAADEDDEHRYQTVYARTPGAVAAPTAGLHFDEALFDRLRARGVEFAHLTLHVGAGTFQPVRVTKLAEHRMHIERYEIPAATVEAIRRAQADRRRVVSVGTTTLRALESAARSGELVAGAGETDLFITPGYRFRTADALITNFHLPKSTLLMLVSAFAGMAPIRRAYRHAVEARYRFFSYGDAMLIDRRE